MARRRRRTWDDDDDFIALDALEGGSPSDRPKPVGVPSRTIDPHDPSAVELLATADIVATQPVPWGSNYSFYVTLACEGEPRAVAVYKPRQGEAPLWDFPSGTLYRREYAAYVVACALGFDFIPPTVIRDGPHGVGTFQLFVEPDRSSEYFKFRHERADDLRAVALFDAITNNADRKPGHCFTSRDGKLWGIDHGLCFNVVPKLRTVIWEFCGQPIPDPLLTRLWDLYTDPARSDILRGDIADLLHPNEIEAFFIRLARVAERGEFPMLDPYHNVPRGFF